MKNDFYNLNNWEVFCLSVNFFLRYDISVPAEDYLLMKFLSKTKKHQPKMYKEFKEYIAEYMKYQ